MRFPAGFVAFVLADRLAPFLRTAAQKSEVIHQEIINLCKEGFLSSDLKDDCDLDKNPDDLDEEELHAWWFQCVCKTSGYAEMLACCVVDEMVDRKLEEATLDPGFVCPFTTGHSVAHCPTYSNAISNFKAAATTSGKSSTSTDSTGSMTRGPTTSFTHTPVAETSTRTSPLRTIGAGSSVGTDESEDNRDNGSNARTIGLGVGLGLGIPFMIGMAGFLGFRYWRSRQPARQLWPETSEQQDPLQEQSPGMSSTLDRWHSPSTFTASAEHGDKRISELTGIAPSERESVQGRFELASDMVPVSELLASSESTNNGGEHRTVK